MKKVILILLVIPALVFAQKPVKPNLNKAIGAWKDGKLKEAKEIIDLSVADPKLSGDGKAWYYKGLIYASLDTTSNEEYKALATNPLATAVEAFKKADEMASGGKEYFVNDPNDIAAAVNNSKPVQLERLANYYLNEGINLIQQDEPDYMKSIEKIEKSKFVFQNAMTKYANDTLAYYVLAIAAQNAERYDTAITAISDYIAKGGTAKEAHILLYQIYVGPKANKEKALEVIQEAKERFPDVAQFSLLEIELLIDLKRIAEAKTGLEQAVKNDPGNKTLHFYLGYSNLSLGDMAAAGKNFEEALKIDPQYFDAQLFLSRVVGEEAKVIKREIDGLGISAADKKRKGELDGVFIDKLKKALPYWEKAEKLNPSDQEVLDELHSIYLYLDMQAQATRIEKRKKELGID